MAMVTHQRRRYWLIQNSMFVVLLISLAGLLGYLARETRIEWDISQNGRNSLSQASMEVLKKINGPLNATVYATVQDAQLGNIRKVIHEFLSRYQRVKPDFMVTFIDPAEQPKLTREAGVQ